MSIKFRWLDLEQTVVRRLADGACIPVDPRNADYAALIAAGETIAPFQRFDDITNARAVLIAEVRAAAGVVIAARYPLHKQVNIMRAGGEEAEAMGVFIDAVRGVSNDLEQEVEEADLEAANDFDLESVEWPN